MTVTIVLADDHQVVRQGLKALLDANPEFYLEVYNWAQAQPVEHDVFEDLVRMHEASQDGVSATPDPKIYTFPDPSLGNVLRIQGLINDVGPVTPDEISHNLLDKVK